MRRTDWINRRMDQDFSGHLPFDSHLHQSKWKPRRESQGFDSINAPGQNPQVGFQKHGLIWNDDGHAKNNSSGHFCLDHRYRAFAMVKKAPGLLDLLTFDQANAPRSLDLKMADRSPGGDA